MDQRTGKRQGASLVLFVVSLFVILGFAGLTIDVGHWYHMQTRLQSCSDAAALAGCTKLPDGPAAVAAARSYCTLNGVADSEVVACRALPEGAATQDRFEVVLLRSAGPFFTAALGVGGVSVGTRSLAVAATRGTGTSDSSGNPDAFDFAIYTGREFDSKGKVAESKLAGNGIVVHGDVHANGDFTISGSSNTIDGKLTTGHDIKVTGSSNEYSSSEQNATKVAMPSLDLDGVKTIAKAQGTYYRLNAGVLQVYNPATGAFQTATSTTIGGDIDSGYFHLPSKTNISGTFYLEGMGVKIDGSSLGGDATFVCDGDIKVSGSGMTMTAESKFAFVSLSSSDQAIHLSGSNDTFYGAWCAPNGLLKFSGSDLKVHGAVIASNIEHNIAGSRIEIWYDEAQATKIPVKTSATETFVRLTE